MRRLLRDNNMKPCIWNFGPQVRWALFRKKCGGGYLPDGVDDSFTERAPILESIFHRFHSMWIEWDRIITHGKKYPQQNLITFPWSDEDYWTGSQLRGCGHFQGSDLSYAVRLAMQSDLGENSDCCGFAVPLPFHCIKFCASYGTSIFFIF